MRKPGAPGQGEDLGVESGYQLDNNWLLLFLGLKVDGLKTFLLGHEDVGEDYTEDIEKLASTYNIS